MRGEGNFTTLRPMAFADISRRVRYKASRLALTCCQVTTDHTLVALSVLIAIGAAYAALSVAGTDHSRLWPLPPPLDGSRRLLLWVSPSASMHYVGMLAFRLPVPVRYNIPLVVWSMIAAVISSAIALAATSRPKLTRLDLFLGSFYMGSAIAAHALHRHGSHARQLRLRLLVAAGDPVDPDRNRRFPGSHWPACSSTRRSRRSGASARQHF